MRAVLADGLEETWQEGSADDLEFERFRVADSDHLGVVVFAVEPVEVLFMRAL